MKALVTGVAGFIGSHLAQRLVNDGHEVIGVDSFTDYYSADVKRRNLSQVQEANGRFRFSAVDLNHTSYLDELMDSVTHIFHQAGQPGVRMSWGESFSAYLDANVSATQRLLEASKGSATLERFVYASSSSVYGDAETYPTTETCRPMPRSPYGVTKLAAEHLCVLYGKNFGVPTASLRYFTVYGPRQRPDMAFSRFLSAAHSGQPIRVFGDGEQIRDFTYVDDIVEANVMAATSEIRPGSVYNVAGGSSVTVNEVLSLMESQIGSRLHIERGSPVSGDVRRTGGATEAFSEVTGWKSAVGLAQGIAQQSDWIRGNGDARGLVGMG